MHVAECLHQRLLTIIDVDHFACWVKRETHSSLLITRMVHGHYVVVDDLRSRVEFLYFDLRYNRSMRQCLEMADVYGVFAGNDAAHGDNFQALTHTPVVAKVKV